MHRRLEQLGADEEGAAIVVAVSGGPDSVAMLHLLAALQEALGLILFVAHLNHGLRGQEAYADETFVEKLARQLEVPFDVERIDLKALQHQEGGNLQALARRHRYAFLHQVARQRKAPWIALGHTLDDQAETILLALIRGAGRRGLSGMAPSRRLSGRTIIRPLIDIERSDLLEFLQGERLPYREDSSNRDLSYRRNRLRHKVLPELRALNPRLSQTLAQMGKVMADEDRFLDSLTRETLRRMSEPMDGDLYRLGREVLWCSHLGSLVDLPPALIRRLIRFLLEGYVGKGNIPLARQVDAILEAIASLKPEWELRLSDEVVILRRYEFLAIVEEASDSHGGDLGQSAPQAVEAEEVIPLPEEGRLSVPALGGALQIERLPKPARWRDLFREEPVARGRRIYLDADKIRGPLALRARQPGDQLPVLGLGGSKKIKELMIEQKLSLEQRCQPRLLVCGADILWLLGGPIHEHYKVDEESRTLLKIEFIPDA